VPRRSNYDKNNLRTRQLNHDTWELLVNELRIALIRNTYTNYYVMGHDELPYTSLDDAVSGALGLLISGQLH